MSAREPEQRHAERQAQGQTQGQAQGQAEQAERLAERQAERHARRLSDRHADGSGVTEVARIRVATDRGVFMISVAAELANMHPQTLRTYEARGLITPKRSPKGTRLYSQRDVERLRRIQEMTADLGLNLAGVERVLALETEVQSMNERIEELEAQALAAEVRLAEELEAVRRSFKAELVPYAQPGGPGMEMVLASQARRSLIARLRDRDRRDGADAS